MDKIKLEQQALSLPLDARAALARKLLESLEKISETEYERLWAEESVRRASLADSGEHEPVSAAVVAGRVRELLG